MRRGDDGRQDEADLGKLLDDLEQEVERHPLSDDSGGLEPSGPRFLVCESAHRLLAVELEAVRSVDLMVEVTPLPRSPTWLLGVVSSRGAILPVFSLADLLGVEGEPLTRLVVVKGTHEMGLAVAAVRGIAELGQVTTGGAGSWVTATARFGDEWVDVLDVGALSRSEQVSRFSAGAGR